MKFNCIECDYECDAKNNFEKHKKTEKHILKTKKLDVKVFECSRCLATFSHASSLSRHKSTCNKNAIIQDRSDAKINDLMEQIKEYKEELLKINQKCEQLREEKYIAIENLRNEKDAEIKKLMERLYEQKVLEVKELKNSAPHMSEDVRSYTMSSHNDETTISAYGYVRKYYKNCPPLKNFEETALLGEDEMEIAENAIYAYKNKKLPVFVGDVLIKVYKKDDINTQSVWSSDINRLAYLIRTKLNEEVDWIKDDKGIKTGAHLIIPALNYIRSAVVNFQIQLAKTMNPENDLKSLKQQELCVLLIKDIDDNILTSQILRYIAPSFKLNKCTLTQKNITDENKIEEYIEEEIDEDS